MEIHDTRFDDAFERRLIVAERTLEAGDADFKRAVRTHQRQLVEYYGQDERTAFVRAVEAEYHAAGLQGYPAGWR